MPAAVAIPLITAGIGATTTAIGAKLSSNAARDAANAQVQAANKAAELQAQSNAQALEFQKQQAAQDLTTANATQQANYNQWAARERRLSNFGAALGLSPRDIPAYQPIPNASSGTSGAKPTNSGPSQWTAEFVAQQLRETGQDPSPQNVQYFLGKESELKARERQLNQPGYALWRVRDPNSGKQGASMPAMAARPVTTLPYRVNSQGTRVLTPALQMPNSFASVMRY